MPRLFLSQKGVFLAIALLAILLPQRNGDAAEPLRVGTAKRSITPDPLLPVSGGLGTPNPTTRKLGDISIRVLVLKQGDEKLVLGSVDALGFPGVLIDRAAGQYPAIAKDRWVIGATHTHSAPDLYAFPDGKGGHTGDLKHIDWVCSQLADAVREADASATESEILVSSGEVQGKIAYNYYAPDLYDRRAGVIVFRNKEDRKTIATLVNYAIHPEVLGSELGICSPDLIGPMCDRIEEKEGGMAIFFNGAQGGMITADNRSLDQPSDPIRGKWKDERTWEECLRIGKALGDEAIRIGKEGVADPMPILRCQSKQVLFPCDSDLLWAVVQHSPLNYPKTENRMLPTRLNRIQLGSALLVTIPGEALPNIGFYLKRKLAAEHPFLLGLTNDAFGYILTEVDFASFPTYRYVSEVSMGEKTGTILIDSILNW
ncbi:MAG: hypothetical protein ACK56Q_00165 [Pirellulaceae bacterium]|jgi:hypothetical protein